MTALSVCPESAKSSTNSTRPAISALGVVMKRAMSKGATLLSSTRNTDAETQYNEIVSLMTALAQSSLSLCSLQMSVAVYGEDEAQATQRILKFNSLSNGWTVTARFFGFVERLVYPF